MAVHKVKSASKRKARKARRNGARARTSVSNGAHSKRRGRRKARRNGASYAARKPRGKRTFRRNGSGNKVRRRRNGVVTSALTNTGKPVEMLLTAGAGALGAVAIGAMAQGLLSKNEWLNKAENDNVKAAIPGVAGIAAGLALAKFTKSKMGKTAGVAMALAGTVILVKDVAGKKIEGYVSKALPGSTKGYQAMAGYQHLGAFGHEPSSLGGFLVQNGQMSPDVGQAAAMFQGY